MIHKEDLISKLQTRLDELNSQIMPMEQGFDRTVMLGRRSELLAAMVAILDMPEEI